MYQPEGDYGAHCAEPVAQGFILLAGAIDFVDRADATFIATGLESREHSECLITNRDDRQLDWN